MDAADEHGVQAKAGVRVARFPTTGRRRGVVLGIHTALARALQWGGTGIRFRQQGTGMLRGGPRSATRHSKPERSVPPSPTRRPAVIVTPLPLARKGALRAPLFPACDPSVPISGWSRARGVPGTWSPSMACSSPATRWSPMTAARPWLSSTGSTDWPP